jgi:hypothetical protein
VFSRPCRPAGFQAGVVQSTPIPPLDWETAMVKLLSKWQRTCFVDGVFHESGS